jgi:MFS family permease
MSSVLDFVSNPLLGDISDAVGRRPVLMTSLWSSFIQITLMAAWIHPAAVVIAFMLRGVTQCTQTMVYAVVSGALCCADGCHG